MPEFYLGIDVGYSKPYATTGLCLITLDQDRLWWECRNATTDECERTDDLRALIPYNAVLRGVGIDGPLCRGLGPVNHYRAAEAMLNHAGIRERCNPSPANSGSGPSLHDHATTLARLFLALQSEKHCNIARADDERYTIHQSCIVEAFPDAFLAFLLPLNEIQAGISRGERSDQYWEVAVANGYLQALIRRLERGVHFDPLGSIRNHDRRAAFICALSAMCVARNKYVAVGAPGSGDIILPPRSVWGADAAAHGSWAEPILGANRNAVIDDNKRRGQPHNFNQARVISNGQPWIPEQRR